jgi:AmiR/NasT family two-component response regulator
MRVLVVDESAERAALLREALTSAGHEVAASLSSSLELLRAVETLQPDVIIMDTESACARFEQYQRMKVELADATLKLSERTLVERAKGLLMHSRGLSEDDAYHALRKLAMSRKRRLGEVAQQLIDSAELLGKT